jgi:ubiquinone/menaquinone biosynthesis C-methylase UbiE
MTELEEHWQEVYATKDTQRVSWYRPHLDRSLEFIRSRQLPKDARIVDIGGGASTLVDDLLGDGFTHLAVIDLSSEALRVAQERLGAKAETVDWIAGNATEPLLDERSVDLWHDRAVLHFLTDEDARRAYREQLLRVLKPGGFASIATFAPDGPEKCSGLPVRRYDAAAMAELLGPELTLIDQARETHETPWGAPQSFAYGFFHRVR